MEIVSCEVCYFTNPYTQQQFDHKNEEITITTAAADMIQHKNTTKTDQELYARGMFMRQNNQRTMAKLKYIESLGYNLVYIWEHEFNAFLSENKELADEISKHPSANFKQLEAHRSLFGGRIEVPISNVGQVERMLFYDYTSLYPSAMLSAKMFVRSPYKILMEKECVDITKDDINNMDGLASRG